MANRKTRLYGEAFSTDDVYLGEIAAQAAQHERAELERTRQLIADQERDVDDMLRSRTNPWSI